MPCLSVPICCWTTCLPRFLRGLAQAVRVGHPYPRRSVPRTTLPCSHSQVILWVSVQVRVCGAWQPRGVLGENVALSSSC